MNIVGERLKVVGSRDPTNLGRSGVAVLETERTLLVDEGGRVIRLQKQGSAFQLTRNGLVLAGEDLAGRLEDRLGRTRR